MSIVGIQTWLAIYQLVLNEHSNKHHSCIKDLDMAIENNCGSSSQSAYVPLIDGTNYELRCLKVKTTFSSQDAWQLIQYGLNIQR